MEAARPHAASAQQANIGVNRAMFIRHGLVHVAFGQLELNRGDQVAV
jgi:hypothetical protein